MRVTLLISGSLNNISGGYIYDRLLVEHLRRSRHSVSVLNIPFHSYTGKLLENLSTSVISQLKELSPNILLQDELDHPALFWLNGRIRAQLSCPIIAIVHHLQSCELHPRWQNQVYAWLERQYLSSVDGFVFVSRTTRLAVESLIGNGHPAITAYPCGDRLAGDITESQVESRARKEGPLQVLFIGNVIRRKGLHVLLAALDRIPRDKCRLTVIGDLSMDKPYVKEVQRMVNRNGLAEKVAFRGSLPDCELVRLLRESHVLAVPSSYEGYGIVYLEGMGFGLPAIASNAGACGEIITSGRNGFLIPFGDDVCLARHLSELSDNRQQLASMSLSALEKFKSHPGWQSTCESITKFLKTVVVK